MIAFRREQVADLGQPYAGRDGLGDPAVKLDALLSGCTVRPPGRQRQLRHDREHAFLEERLQPLRRPPAFAPSSLLPEETVERTDLVTAPRLRH